MRLDLHVRTAWIVDVSWCLYLPVGWPELVSEKSFSFRCLSVPFCSGLFVASESLFCSALLLLSGRKRHRRVHDDGHRAAPVRDLGCALAAVCEPVQGLA
jgi:hypothetical protein